MPDRVYSRRAVLSGGAAVVAAVAGCSEFLGGGDVPREELPPNDGSTGGTSSPTDSPRSIRLLARREGWVGALPRQLEEKTNPSLRLDTGVTYEITWVNVDGQRHELVIENEAGEELVSTDPAAERGATRSVTFTASEQMAYYYCRNHPDQKRGFISIDYGSSRMAKRQA